MLAENTGGWGVYPSLAMFDPTTFACTTLPTVSTWYSTVNSNAPWSGTTAAMPYEWVRVNWKLNNSASYLTGTTINHVTTLSTSTYSVNGTQAAASPVCWNGASEVVLTAGSSCNTLTTGGTAATPVFVITALGVTSTGARQMVQEEVAAQPPTVISTPAGFNDPDGFFAASSLCSSTSSPLQIAGNASTDGYSSANGGTYATTKSNKRSRSDRCHIRAVVTLPALVSIFCSFETQFNGSHRT